MSCVYRCVRMLLVFWFGAGLPQPIHRCPPKADVEGPQPTHTPNRSPASGVRSNNLLHPSNTRIPRFAQSSPLPQRARYQSYAYRWMSASCCRKLPCILSWHVAPGGYLVNAPGHDRTCVASGRSLQNCHLHDSKCIPRTGVCIGLFTICSLP